MSHQALPTAQCSDGALIRFDLAHIIEVECVIAQGIKQLMAGGGVVLIGTTLIPLLSGLFG